MSIDSQFSKENLWNRYKEFKNEDITTRRFKYEEIEKIIGDLKDSKVYQIELLGKSFEERNIYKVSWGSGDIPVLLWSQMHGNESTATRAFCDIVNFFNSSDEFDEIRNHIKEKLTIHFIPVLNPDGMERFQRRTAQEIDLNRDAVRVQTPESMILRKAREETNAVFGFNLHDQKIYYGAGNSGKPATIAFLAPPFNPSNEVNDVRKRAMQMIVELDELLQEKIPGMVARYDDEYNPRAFGDNIQKWGTSTVLVESGGYPEDPEKEYIRKLNFYLLINALYSISKEGYISKSVDSYYGIPENKEIYFDLIIRNAAITKGGRQYKADIGILREDISYNDSRDFYYKATVADIGDLSMYFGYEEIDINGMECKMGELYPYEFDTHYELASFDFKKMLDHGYTHALIKDSLKNEQFVDFPVNILSNTDKEEGEIEIDGDANFTIIDANKVMATIVNGFLYRPDEEIRIVNGLVY